MKKMQVFNVYAAQAYGLEEAIILDNLYEFPGWAWEKLRERCPYMDAETFMRAVLHLWDAGLITRIVENDGAKWYLEGKNSETKERTD